MRRQADGEGVAISLAMIDDEGDLASTQDSARRDAVARHRRWIDRAHTLGCRALRVNTGAEDVVAFDAPLGDTALEAALDRCAASCRELCSYAAGAGIDVLIENHGGLSSNVPAVVTLQQRVGATNFGTLPDFGNMPPGVDRYDVVARMMPYARAVSAKCYDFDFGADSDGGETSIDFPRMLDIVRDAGYDGAVGIEYEGDRLDEFAGVRACHALLRRLLES